MELDTEMDDEYTIQIDTALSMLAERINTIEASIEELRSIDIPSDIIEMYAKTKVVGKYIGMGFSRYEALQLANIEVPENMSKQTVEASEVVEGYQTTMRSLQTSIEALKAVFDYAKDTDEYSGKQTEGQMLVDEEEAAKEYEEEEDMKEGTGSEETEASEDGRGKETEEEDIGDQ